MTSTPLKKASLFLGSKFISPKSPRLLSPRENKNGFSPPQIKLGQNLNLSKNSEENNTIKSKVQIRLNDKSVSESLIIDSPHKTDLLSYGPNKYDLLYSLGRGSFGTVIKGKYKGSTVALKIVKLDKFSNGINETNARDLVHKNVIRILDIIVSEKYALVVMEYYKNSRNLQCVLDDLSFVFNKQTTINFSRDIACGLKYCHENGVLHLDIKPKNLLVCNNICKICDFGNSVKELVGTQTFKYHGTVAYTAPEILKGREPSAKSDIYSLGILIWQMMSRKCPYELLDNEVVIYKVVKFNFRPPLDLLKEDGLSKLCCLCWDEKPTNRPSAAQASDFLNNL
ncbi:unnamed protein product [Tenebrio molitor]|nr:unnamed protein product [Tenebrio molitor]